MCAVALLLDNVNDGSVISHPVAGGPNGIVAATSMKPSLRLVVVLLAVECAVPVAAVQRPAPSSLRDVLLRVAEYIRTSTPEWANIVAEETYEQERASKPSSARRLLSDALLVVTGRDELMFFRDVTTVDGRMVPDKTARLQELFVAPAGKVADVVWRVAYESERHHLAGGSFVVTNPWKVVAVLQTRFQGRLRLELGDEAQDLGPGVRELRFTEPPLAGSERNVLDPLGGAPLFGEEGGRGRAWVDVASGRILKTAFSPGQDQRTASSTVTFARDTRLGVMVPVSMATTWVDPDTKRPVEGLASYRNYRRFDVRTELNLPGPREP